MIEFCFSCILFISSSIILAERWKLLILLFNLLTHIFSLLHSIPLQLNSFSYFLDLPPTFPFPFSFTFIFILKFCFFFQNILFSSFYIIYVLVFWVAIERYVWCYGICFSYSYCKIRCGCLLSLKQSVIKCIYDFSSDVFLARASIIFSLNNRISVKAIDKNYAIFILK